MVALFFSARILTELAGERNTRTIAIYVTLTVGLSFLSSILWPIIDHMMWKKGLFTFGQQYSRYEGVKFAEMDYEYVDSAEVHQLRENISMRRTNNMGLDWIFNLPDLFGEVVRLIAAAVLLSGMFTANPDGSFINSPWVVVLLLAVSIAVPALTGSFFNGRHNNIMEEISAAQSKSNAAVGYYNRSFVAGWGGGKDIRIFGLKETIMQSVEKCFSWYRGRWIGERNFFQAVMAGMGIAFSILAYLVIGLRAINGMYDIGQVTMFVGAVAAFSNGVVPVVLKISGMLQNAPHLATLYEFLDLPSQKYAGTLTTEKRTDHEYELEFKNVSFKYPGADSYALKNVNLKLNVGKRMAVVGRNGSGKTTLIKLLCRLYDPTEGEITLNGIDIRKYKLVDYIKIFSVVFQDFALPHLPLGENVAASAEYDAERATDALEKAGFGSRLSELEMGLDTPLFKGADHNGVLVSGGEAQKIALARALYKNSPFVILDEPTSALDPLAEYEIYSKFDQIVEDKTAIYISHRLSSCRFCDYIAVFEGGQLTQLGGHDELLANTNSSYYKMWNAQAQYYEQEVLHSH